MLQCLGGLLPPPDTLASHRGALRRSYSSTGVDALTVTRGWGAARCHCGVSARMFFAHARREHARHVAIRASRGGGDAQEEIR